MLLGGIGATSSKPVTACDRNLILVKVGGRNPILQSNNIPTLQKKTKECYLAPPRTSTQMQQQLSVAEVEQTQVTDKQIKPGRIN